MSHNHLPLNDNDWIFAESLFDLSGPAPLDEPEMSHPQQGAVRDANSVRYAILQRLAPALRHDMLVNLQAITMMADVLSARLERGPVDTALLQKNLSKINRLSREAVLANLKVVTWIDPGDDEGINLSQGIQECLDLLSAFFNFSQLYLDNHVGTVKFDVSRFGLRNVLAGVLLFLADTVPGPADVVIDAQVTGADALLGISHARRYPRDAVSDRGAPPGFHNQSVRWEDICALAQAESMTLVQDDGRILLSVPRKRNTTPLKMAAA